MLPRLIVEVAFDTDPLDPSPAWEDISAYCDGVSVDFGKQAQLDAYQPGKLTVRLKNDDRRFDPLHATGPYFGKILPRKKLRVRAVWAGVTYEVYTGFVDGWTQRPSGQATQTITVTCTDLFGILANIELPSSVYALEVAADAPKAWWRLSETVGPSLADSSGNKYDGTYNTAVLNSVQHPGPFETTTAQQFTSESTATNVPDAAVRFQIADTDCVIEGVFTISQDAVDDDPALSRIMAFFRQGGGIQPLDRTYQVGLRQDAAGTLWRFVGRGSAGTGGSESADYELSALIALGPIHFAARYPLGATADLRLNGATISGGPLIGFTNAEAQYIVSPGTTTAVPWQGVVADVAMYTSLSDARILAHATALSAPWDGDTTGERIVRLLELVPLDSSQYDVDTGVTLLGPAFLARTVLEHLRLLEATEQGNLYVDHADEGKLRFDDRHVRLTATRSTVVQATFTDESTPGAIHVERESIEVLNDWQLIYNEVTVTFAGGATVTATDAASILATGRRSHSIETVIATASEARNLAEWVLSHYKDPIARIQSLTLNSAGDDSSAVASLDLRLGDLVEVKFKPQNVGARETFRLLVEGKQPTFDKAAGSWTTTLYLSPAETKVYGMWGSGLWGSALWGY